MMLNSPLVYVLVGLVLCYGVDGFIGQVRMQHGPTQSVRSLRRMRLSSRVEQIDVASEGYQIIPDMFQTAAFKIGDQPCIDDYLHLAGNTSTLTFQQVHSMIQACATTLQQQFHLAPNECVAMFSENSYKWLVADQAIMTCGAHNAVRGASAPVPELDFIYRNSDCVGLVVENVELLQKLLSSAEFLREKSDGARAFSAPRFVAVLYRDGQPGASIRHTLLQQDSTGTLSAALQNTTFTTFEELLSSPTSRAQLRPVSKDPDSLATIVYTSGTTNQPKGVMLTHRNLLSQVLYNSFSRAPGNPLDPKVGDVLLSILPCWHIFERAAEYCFLARGATLTYSSIKTLKVDLESKRPHYLIAVPRLYESLYKSITGSFKQARGAKKALITLAVVVTAAFLRARDTSKGLVLGATAPGKIEKLIVSVKMLVLWPLWRVLDVLVWAKVRQSLGGRLKVTVSGGALLPPYLESFFAMTGLQLLAGYGLTETSPVVCNQLAERRVQGTIGALAPHTEIKVIDPATGLEVPAGAEGVLKVRGPGVMRGYIHDATATKAAFDAQGYFDTGDLVRLNVATGDLVITGRFKDTIVLSNGENVAPQPIEDALVGASDLVDQAMLIGQDQRSLTAVVVVNVPALLEKGLITATQATHWTTLLAELISARAAVDSAKSSDHADGASRGMRGANGSAGSALEEVQGRLRTATAELNADPAAKRAVLSDIEQVNLSLKPWERVKGLLLLLEPFSLSNQQLTQTLKVKRHQVLRDYSVALQPFLPLGNEGTRSRDGKKR